MSCNWRKINTDHDLVNNAAMNFITLIAAIPLLVASFYLVAATDQKFFPPIVDMRAIDYSVDGDTSLSVHLIGRKVRDCKPVQIQGWYNAEGGAKVMDIEFLTPRAGDGDNPRQIRNIGPHDFGWWKLVPRPDSKDGIFWVAVIHQCNPLYTQKTTLGPFSYKEFLQRKSKEGGLATINKGLKNK